MTVYFVRQPCFPLPPSSRGSGNPSSIPIPTKTFVVCAFFGTSNLLPMREPPVPTYLIMPFSLAMTICSNAFELQLANISPSSSNINSPSSGNHILLAQLIENAIEKDTPAG